MNINIFIGILGFVLAVSVVENMFFSKRASFLKIIFQLILFFIIIGGIASFDSRPLSGFVANANMEILTSGDMIKYDSKYYIAQGEETKISSFVADIMGKKITFPRSKFPSTFEFEYLGDEKPEALKYKGYIAKHSIDVFISTFVLTFILGVLILMVSGRRNNT